MIRKFLIGMLLALTAPAVLAQAFDSNSFSTTSFSESSFDFGSAPPPVVPICSYRNGVALACNGSIVSVFLGQGQAPSAGLRYIEGMAFSTNGRMYVALWPNSGTVRYVEGFALRSDGVRIISTGGTRTGYRDGIAITSRGETLATENAPTKYVQGVGIDSRGYLSVTDTN